MAENIPQIRFKGFKDNWEQYTLNNLTDIKGGGTPSTSVDEYWGGDIDWYSPTEIGNDIYAYGSSKKITDKGLKKSSAKILPADNTILFTSRAGIGNMAILKKSGTTNQGFQSMVVKDSNDVYFIYSLGYKLKRLALKMAAGSTFLEISGKILGKIKVNIPIKEEQTKIGNLFNQLDENIALRHHKLDLLKQRKMAFLQDMFPKKGEKVPQIRFQGFTEEWKQKKLGDLLAYEQPTRYIVDSDMYQDDYTTPVLTVGKTFILGYTGETTGVYDKGKVILFDDFTTDFRFIDFLFKVKSSAIKILTPKKNNNLRFLYEAMKGIQYPTNDHKRYWISEFTSLKIYLPTSIEEQLEIGNFFKELDDSITLHEKEINSLKQMKKALLQKMFV